MAMINGRSPRATNAETLAGSDTSRIVTPDDLKYVLDIRLQQYYGVSWDESADTYVRTGATAGHTCGVTLADAFLSVHRRMRRCILNDDGTVNYYLSATDSTKKEGPAYATGTITSDGTIPEDGDTVTIGSKTYTFKTALTPTEGQVLIGVSAATALDNLKSAIMLTGTPDTDYKCAAVHPQVIATDNTDTTQVVVSVAGGTAGNAYALAVSDANMSVSGAFMTGGAANATAVLDGTDGQVMVEIPKFWYRYGYSGTTHTWEISPVPLTGFEVHPAFMSDATELDYAYVSAYEASLEDVSASLFVGQCYQTAVSAVFATSDDSITIATRTGWTNALKVGQKLIVSGASAPNNITVTVKAIESATKITVDENLTDETAATTVIQTVTDTTATTGDKLASVSGVCPISGGSANGTRAHFRVWASNRGAGWSQMMIDVHSAIQLLYLTEYASFYSQSVLGYGIAAVADWPAYNDQNPIAKTGNSNVVGNASGNTATAAITTGVGAQSVYLSYRGLENYYGHIWKWLDGINTNNNRSYICNVAANLADDTTSNYTDIGVNNKADAGYQNTLLNISRGFLPANTADSDASHKITDYYWQNTGWRVAVSGGRADYALTDGCFCLSLYRAAADFNAAIGSRVVFRK